MTEQEIVQRAEALKANRSNIESKWREIDRLVMPLQQGDFAQTIAHENSKDWDTLDVWDSTAPIGADRLVAMLHSTLLSGRWFGAGFRNSKMNQTPKARAWLDDCVDRLFDAIMASNFLSETAVAFSEWVGYGNMALAMALVNEMEWEGFEFSCRSVRGLLFEPSWNGMPYRAYEIFEWSPVQIVSKFRDPNDKSKPSPRIPDAILQRAAATNGVSEKVKVIFAVYPRDGVKPLGADGPKMRAASERPFGWKYVLADGAVLLEEGGYEDGICTFVAPWARSATSQWGYGPSLLALPTVKLLNAIQEQVVNAGAKVIDPATIVTERGLLSDLDLGPQGLTTVRSMDDIAPFESKARFDVSEMLLSDHRGMVRKFFREDDITLKDSPQMTATEVNRRFVLLNRFLSPPVKHGHFFMFAPVIQTGFNMMYRMGQFDPPPDEVLQGKPRMQIEFYGPLMTAMRDDEVAAIERLIAASAAMTKLNPNSPAKYKVKDDVVLAEMAERLAVPGTILASDQEVQEAMERDQKMQQAAALAQVHKMKAEGDRAAAGAQDMMGGAGGGMGGGGGMPMGGAQ